MKLLMLLLVTFTLAKIEPKTSKAQNVKFSGPKPDLKSLFSSDDDSADQMKLVPLKQ